MIYDGGDYFLIISIKNKNYGDNWIYGGFSNSSDEIFLHFVWEKGITARI